MEGFVLPSNNKEDISELIRILQEEIIPNYNYLLEIDFPNEEELKEMKGLKEMLELTKPIIDSCAYVLQNNFLQTDKDIFINANLQSEKGNNDTLMGYEKPKNSYKVVMEEELNEQSKY